MKKNNIENNDFHDDKNWDDDSVRVGSIPDPENMQSYYRGVGAEVSDEFSLWQDPEYNYEDKEKKYFWHYIIDSKLAYLKVEMDEIVSLGCKKYFSHHSYISKDEKYAYLVNGCDLETFLSFLKKSGVNGEEKMSYKGIGYDRNDFIHSFAKYPYGDIEILKKIWPYLYE